MSSMPYRVEAPPAARESPAQDDRMHDRDVVAVLALFWAISLARVVRGLVSHEVLAAEWTLALLALLAVPWLLRGRPARAARELGRLEDARRIALLRGGSV